jgi:hypothetical protein
MGKCECPQFLQLRYLHKTFFLGLIESVLTNHNKFFHNVCVSSSLFHTSSPYIPVAVMFTVTAPRTLTLITIPPLPAPSQSAFRTLRRARVVFLLL